MEDLNVLRLLLFWVVNDLKTIEQSFLINVQLFLRMKIGNSVMLCSEA